MSKPNVLCFEKYDSWDSTAMGEQFNVYQFPESGDLNEFDASLKQKIEAFAFKGHSVLGAAVIDEFPNLRLIANYGVGYDTIDVAHASDKGIKVTNTPDVLTNDVADLAIGMLLAFNRGIVQADHWVRSGSWQDRGTYPLQRTLSDVPVGIAGLGRIGRAVAQRLQGFDTNIHYYSRQEKNVSGWTYHRKLTDLASAVDVLIVTVSGGPDTHQIISQQVIKALGTDGVLVNVSRGSTVDEEALINALEAGLIRGAALDVYNNEPHVDERFKHLDNVLLQPHQSSGTVETRKRMGELQRANIVSFFKDGSLLTAVN